MNTKQSFKPFSNVNSLFFIQKSVKIKFSRSLFYHVVASSTPLHGLGIPNCASIAIRFIGILIFLVIRIRIFSEGRLLKSSFILEGFQKYYWGT